MPLRLTFGTPLENLRNSQQLAKERNLSRSDLQPDMLHRRLKLTALSVRALMMNVRMYYAHTSMQHNFAGMGPVLDSTSQSQGGRPISSLPLVKVVHVPAKGEDSSEDPELLLFAEVFIPPLPAVS